MDKEAKLEPETLVTFAQIKTAQPKVEKSFLFSCSVKSPQKTCEYRLSMFYLSFCGIISRGLSSLNCHPAATLEPEKVEKSHTITKFKARI